MDLPPFYGGTSGDVHEFFSTSRELLESVVLDESMGFVMIYSSYVGQLWSGGESIYDLCRLDLDMPVFRGTFNVFSLRFVCV